MNKIYKVIWSKTRNCYVAVSEIAKRNGKSCTSVNCGVKAKRSRVALALALALCVTGGAVFTMPQAASADYNITEAGSYKINSDFSDTYVNLNASNIKLTVGSSGIVGGISGYPSLSLAISGNQVKIEGGSVNSIIYGGLSSGEVSGNAVTITGGTVASNVCGGRTNSGSYALTSNSVTIEQSIPGIETTINGAVYGGLNDNSSGTGDSKSNNVTIAGGTVKGSIYGGYAFGNTRYSNVAENNMVTISDGTLTGYFIYGGAAYGDAIANTVDISGGNIRRDAYSGKIYGGYSSNGNAGGDTADKGNKVIISGGTVNADVYGGYIDNGDGAAKNNIVTIDNSCVDRVVGAYSGNGSVKGNTVTVNGIKEGMSYTVNSVFGGNSEKGLVGGEGANDGNKVIISNGAIVSSYVYGGSSGYGSAIGNSVIIGQTGDGTNIVRGNVYGGYVSYESGSANGNTVNISNGSIIETNSNVYGGYVSRGSGSANGNTVNISNGSTIKGDVYGGYNKGSGSSNNNSVDINGGTIWGSIYGGYITGSGTATGNTVNLLGTTTISAGVVGSNTNDVTGNELHIGGKKGSTTTSSDNIWKNGTTNKVNNVNNFATISLHDVAWSTTVPALEATTVSNVGMLDITNMTMYGSGGPGESMSLLKTGHDISSVTLKYNEGAAVSLVGNPVTLGGAAFTDAVIIADLLKFSGTRKDTVSLASLVVENDAIVYTAGGESMVTSATFNGTADWNDGGVLYTNESFDFASGATTDLTDLKFNDTTVTEDPTGKSMTLIKGKVAGTVASPPTDASVTVSLDKTNTTLGAKASGTAAIVGGNLVYTLDTVKLNSVTVKSVSDTADDVPTGWTKGTTVTVDTGSTALDLATETDILTSEIGGLFTGATFSGVNDFNDTANNKHAFASDTDKGVTLDGNQIKGVKASDDGKNLVYAVDATKNVEKITLGKVNTTDPRDMSGTDFDFASTTKVDATGLELELTEPLDIGKSVALVKNAANLTAGASVTYKDDAAKHTQEFTLAHPDTKIDVTGELSGTVATADKEVQFTSTGLEMKAVNLANWDGQAAEEDAFNGWTGSGVAVETGNFANPGLAAGKSVDIITTSTANFFDKDKVTGDKAFKEEAFANDTAEGVTLSGNKFGGVTTTNDNKVLTYYAETMGVDNVSLGEMTWGTARAAATGYDFTKVKTVDATELSFTNPEEVTGSKDLLTDATNLAAGAAVSYKDGKVNHAQEFEKTLDNKAIVTATLTGTVDTSAAGKISYSSTGTSMSKINLAGWDGANASAVPTDWTLTGDATIETDGMTAPVVDPGNHIDIIQSSTDNFFANAKINGANAYADSAFTEEDGGITFTGSQSKGVTLNSEKNHIIYAAGTKDVTKATVAGEISWTDGGTYYDNTKYTFTGDSVTDVAGVTFTSTTDPLNKSMVLISNAKGTVTGTPDFAVKLSNTTLAATAAGNATTGEGNLGFTVTGVTLDAVAVTGAGDDAIPAGWTTNTDGVKVDTDTMTDLPSDVPAGSSKPILTATVENTFVDDNISGSNKYGANPDRFTQEDETQGAVAIAGKQDKGVKADDSGKSLVYAVGTKDVSSVAIGAVKWAAGSELLDGSRTEYNYGGDTSPVSVDTSNFVMSFDAPEKVAAGESMTLLKANNTLKAIVNEEKTKAYIATNLAEGVTLDAHITGALKTSSNSVVFTPTANQADILTFGSVKWDESTPLMTRPSNIVFDGAKVVTTDINFYNINEQYADKQMTLVKGFDGTPSGIEGTHYTVGSGLRGEGSAEMYGSDLIFKTKTGTERATEATHETVMAMEAGTAVVAAGREFVDNAIEGLGLTANMSPDGTSTFAAMGGGSNRYKTGSHVNTHTWNALVAVGSKKEHKKGDMEWGVFAEYGRGNYTLHDDNGGRGDGDTHYAGGGLLAKWTNKHDVYTEASFRLGRMSDSAKNMLADNVGNRYGYDVHANYYGFHVGLGKIYKMKGNHDLDVYGKFFYTKRNGVNFDAGGNHYDLDSVNSSLLRIGARYGSNDKKWNWYGGLAYEYEFDGDASGTVSSGGISAAIRSASIKGSSVRGELGMRMDATKTNPWKADIGIYGYGGRHRGFGGTVNVAYVF